MALSKSEIRKISKFLPVDWALKIAEGTGFTADYARRVLQGKRENLQILSQIIDMAYAEKSKQEQIKKQQVKILKNL